MSVVTSCAISATSAACATPNDRIRWLRLLIPVMIVKGLFLLLDHQPAFHFGDSGAYLATALLKWIPPDRSFTYGLLLRPLVLASHSLLPVVWLQVAASAAASVVAGLLLWRYFHASWTTASIFAALCAIEPLQLMSERFVMTEALATCCFAFFVWICCLFLERRSLAALLSCQLVGVVLVSLRYSFLPLVVTLSFLLPLLAAWRGPFSVNWKVLMVRIGLAMAVSQLLLGGYRHLYGKLADTKPAYLSRDGEFLVADFAPLILPEDFPIAAERTKLFQKITIPRTGIDDRRFQRWLPGGICDAIVQIANSDEELGNALARRTALHAIRRDPRGAARLVLLTYLEFFDYEKVSWALKLDSGYFVGPSGNDISMIKHWFGVDATERRFDSLTKRWERQAVLWCMLIVTLPCLYGMEMAFHGRRATRFDLLLFCAALCILVAAIGPVEIANPRYLMPLPWLAVLIIGAVVSRLLVSNPQTGTPKAGLSTQFRLLNATSGTSR